MQPMFGEGATLIGGGVIGAAALKLAQVWLEMRGKAPSRAMDTASLITATAAFQAALNAASDTIVEQLEKRCERQDAQIENLMREVDGLKRENEQCRRESEALLQRDRERQQQFASLTRLLKARGIDLSSEGLEGSLIHLEGDRADVLIPGPMEHGE